MEVSDQRPCAEDQNGRESRDSSIWHIAPGHGKKISTLSNFKKNLYTMIALKKSCENDIITRHWECIVIEITPENSWKSGDSVININNVNIGIRTIAPRGKLSPGKGQDLDQGQG